VAFNPRLKFVLSSLMRKIADVKPCHVFLHLSLTLVAIGIPGTAKMA
jgi:hypothetical protein